MCITDTNIKMTKYLYNDNYAMVYPFDVDMEGCMRIVAKILYKEKSKCSFNHIPLSPYSTSKKQWRFLMLEGEAVVFGDGETMLEALYKCLTKYFEDESKTTKT